MRIVRLTVALACLAAPLARPLGAQADSTSRARQDSIAKAVKDSIELMKALGAATASDSTPAASGAAGPQVGPSNPRLLPDFSAVVDLFGDLSPTRSTQENGRRFYPREVELAVQAVVDPYFRGDVFLGLSDEEGIAIEQAYITTTSLPHALEARLGRYLLPFGKQNTTHRHDLHTTEYPLVLQRFFTPEGIAGTGVWGSRVFAPFGFYQELIVTADDRLSFEDDGLTTAEPASRTLGGLGYSARLRNYRDLTQAANVELSFSALTTKRAQPLAEGAVLQPDAQGNAVNAVNARQSVFGADLTYRWRPLQQGLYRSFILQAEVMRQVNEREPSVPLAVPPPCPGCEASALYAGPTRDFTGAYVFARNQLTRRGFVGARYDYVQDPLALGRTLQAGSLYYEWFPSEFSKLIAGYEAQRAQGTDVVHRLLVEATFAIGPHRPHPF